MDDDIFTAFISGKSEPPREISAATLEDMIRNDEAKKKFIQKWTNMFDDGQGSALPVTSKHKKHSSHHIRGTTSSKKLGSHSHESKNVISASTFENILQKEQSKKKFIQSWSNVLERKSVREPISFDETHSAVGSIETVLVSSNLDEKTKTVVVVLETDMSMELMQSTVKYIEAHWDPEAPLASTFPLLQNLEDEFGPGWRLDKIVEPKGTPPGAVANTTLKFLCYGNPTMYAIWRNCEQDSTSQL